MMWQTREGEKSEVVKNAIISWSIKEGIPICHIEFTTGVTKHLGVFIFYKTDAELKRQMENEKIEKTKVEILRILTEFDYNERYSDGIIFEFDSDENVKKNYKGNYFFRLR